MIIVGIITSIILFSIIVLIHEWGHFAAARKFGVKVEEFGLGIPPRAKKLFIDKKGTLFSLNWLPIGGFVKLTGEMPNTFLVYNEKKELYNNADLENDLKNGKDIYNNKGEEISINDKKEILEKLKENSADYNLMNKPAWQQAIIILAGVFMNFLLAAFIFSILFFLGIKPLGINTKIETNLDLKLIPTYEQAIKSGLLIKKEGIIVTPVIDSLAIKSGIKENTIIIKINDQQISNLEKFKIYLEENKNKTIILEDNQSNTFKINLGDNGKIGAYIGENIEINKDFKYKYNFLNSIKYGTLETYNQTLLTFKGLGILIKKIFNPETPKERQEAIQQVSGPIGIVDFITNSIQGGIIFLLVIGAIISINLGVFNLLPIPALDGGRFIFITINGLIKKIFGRKAISEKTEGYIHVGFFIVLIALSLLIAYNDINKIIIR